MSFVSAKNIVLGALALGAAGVVAVAPAQASHFDDEGDRQEVVVVKKSVSHAAHDFDDDEDHVRRSVVVKKRVYDEDEDDVRHSFVRKRAYDEDFGRPERVIVEKQVVKPVTIVRRVVQPVKVIVRERVVQPVTVVKRVVRPVRVVTKQIVHTADEFRGPRRASYGHGFHSGF